MRNLPERSFPRDDSRSIEREKEGGREGDRFVPFLSFSFVISSSRCDISRSVYLSHSFSFFPLLTGCGVAESRATDVFSDVE